MRVITIPFTLSLILIFTLPACEPPTSGDRAAESDAQVLPGAVTASGTAGAATGTATGSSLPAGTGTGQGGITAGGTTTGAADGADGTVSVDGAATGGAATGGAATGGAATGGAATGGASGGGTGAIPPNGMCVPGERQCSVDILVQCNAQGTSWDKMETCAPGTLCDAASGSCVCQKSCTGKQCGDDGCGGSCGTCSGDTVCNAAGQCGAAANCVAAGTGTTVGKKAKNITWTNGDNKKVELHSYCGSKKGVLLIETAPW